MLKASAAASLIVAALWLMPARRDDVKVVWERNTGPDATGEFRFKRVPAPAKADAATQAQLSLIVGQRDGASASLSALTDGRTPANEDEPRLNFFFNAGSDGGRFRLDFGDVIEIAEVNTYSWHSNTRAPQVYNLFASDGGGAKFNPAPDDQTDPRDCGWHLVATVDTRPQRGDAGGQYGVSVRAEGASLGKYRYLLFDSVPTEYDDPFSNTFFSEVDVLAKR